jgi:cell division protease FtsH
VNDQKKINNTEPPADNKIPPANRFDPKGPIPPNLKGFSFMIKLDPKKVLIWLLVAFMIGSFLFQNQGPAIEGKKNLSQVLVDIKDNKVAKIGVEGDTLQVEYFDGKVFTSRKEPQVSIEEVLKAADLNPASINYEVKDLSFTKAFGNILEIIIPVVLTGILFLWIFRQARGAQDSIFSFGRSHAQLFSKGKQHITFNDVAGVDESKKEMEEIVDFLKHPKKYRALGARTPKGALLIGPAGTGKTLLAKAVAGEANVPFFSMAGSEFMEMLVGVGASRVRDLFLTAKKSAPAIIFIDEIDAIGRMRGYGVSGGHDEREQTLNQILVEMDGFTPNDNVIVLAATNRGDLLDPALMRPGRFDRRIMIDMPDFEGRESILKIHARGKPFAKDVNWEKVAKRTVGFSGADLENMLNEAAILTARFNKKEIFFSEIEEAATKVKLGPEKKRLQTDLDKKMTAYHEAGHAVLSYKLENADPVHRISIVSRGQTLGFTLIPPTRDRLHVTRTYLMEKMVTIMGGRAAEEEVFNEITTGAANDFLQATNIARDMVIEYGMSSLGPINYGPQMDVTDWGKSYFEPTPVSQEMQAKIDAEVTKIVTNAYEKAKKIIGQSRAQLDGIAKELVKKETLEQEEFERIMKAAAKEA